MITIDKNEDNREVWRCGDNFTIDCLKQVVRELFNLQPGSIERLQIWREKFHGYVNLKPDDVCKIQDGCKINVSLYIIMF